MFQTSEKDIVIIDLDAFTALQRIARNAEIALEKLENNEEVVRVEHQWGHARYEFINPTDATKNLNSKITIQEEELAILKKRLSSPIARLFKI